MIQVKCERCGKRKRKYPSDLAHSKHGKYFCSAKCRAEWVSWFNSVSRGGDGEKRSKSEKDAIYYRKRSEKVIARCKAYYQKNRLEILRKKSEADRILKSEIVQEYGGKCECCGEEVIEFLTVDHVNGDGASHRREIGGKGRRLYLAIKRAGFPKDRYRLLCFNCNIARGFYGYCPHKPEEKTNVCHVPFRAGRPQKIGLLFPL